MKSKPTIIETWGEHLAQEFVHKNVDATMRTMSDEPQVICVPVATGGRGRIAVRTIETS
jgi:carboxymethylenebutenolidase